MKNYGIDKLDQKGSWAGSGWDKIPVSELEVPVRETKSEGKLSKREGCIRSPISDRGNGVLHILRSNCRRLWLRKSCGSHEPRGHGAWWLFGWMLIPWSQGRQNGRENWARTANRKHCKPVALKNSQPIHKLFFSFNEEHHSSSPHRKHYTGPEDPNP